MRPHRLPRGPASFRQIESHANAGPFPLTMEVKNEALAALVLGGALFGSITAASAEEFDWQKVDSTLGRKSAVTGDVHRYGFPRSDLAVTLDGVAIKPALALGGWIAFKPTHGETMAMGDIVLLESEVNPVMAKLTQAGFEITGVHNHLLRAKPAVMYVHVASHGNPVELAATLRDALAVREKFPDHGCCPACAGGRPRYGATRADHRRQGPSEWRRLSVRRSTSGSDH